jgi:8-oxo-dGTP diphosphatase
MIWRDGRILLGRRQGAHGGDTWGWCGGHLEFGESLETCAAREIAEESGLQVAPRDLKPLCHHNVLAYGTHYGDVEFWTDTSHGEPAIKEKTKTCEWDWFTLDALPAPLFEPVSLAISAWRDGAWYRPLPISRRGSP